MTIKIETIQELMYHEHTLTAVCYDQRNGIPCSHYQLLDLPALRERLGPDHLAMHDALVPKLRCSKCGSKLVGLIRSPPTVRTLE